MLYFLTVPEIIKSVYILVKYCKIVKKKIVKKYLDYNVLLFTLITKMSRTTLSFQGREKGSQEGRSPEAKRIR